MDQDVALLSGQDKCRINYVFFRLLKLHFSGRRSWGFRLAAEWNYLRCQFMGSFGYSLDLRTNNFNCGPTVQIGDDCVYVQ